MLKCSANATNGHLGKYATTAAKHGGGFTAYTFNYSQHVLAINPAKGAVMPKPGSVQGTIVGMVQAKPGITGAALLAVMLAHNWQAFAGRTGHINPVTGAASAPWCIGYIAGLVARGNKGHLALVASVASVAAKAPSVAPQAAKATPAAKAPK